MNSTPHQNDKPLRTDKHGNVFRKTSFKFGLMAAVLSLAMVALFVVINVVFFLLGQRANLEVDMTAQQLYSVSDEAQNFLRTLQTPVTITVFQDDTKFDPRTMQALNNYDKLSDNVTLQRVDLNLNPGFVNAFQGQSFSENSMVVHSAVNYQVFKETDLYYLEESARGVTVVGIKLDQKLCAAIANAIDPKRSTMAVIEGHGETVSDELLSLGEATGRSSKAVNLMSGDLDKSADVAVICAPTVDFETVEIKKLEDFLLAGNNRLLVFLDAQTGRLPILQAFLQEWGIVLQDDIVIDLDHYWGASQTYLLTEYPDTVVIGKSQKEKNITAVMPMSRSLTLKESQSEQYQVFSILRSYDTAYAKNMSANLNTLNKTAGDKTGTFLLAAGSSTNHVINNQTHTSTVMLFGSAAMSADALLQSPALANRLILLDAMTYGVQQTAIMGIQPIYLKNVALQMTSAQVQFLKILLVCLLPAALCMTGILVNVKRKRQ